MPSQPNMTARNCNHDRIACGSSTMQISAGFMAVNVCGRRERAPFQIKSLQCARHWLLAGDGSAKPKKI